jgi:hypothetical protein
VQGETFDSFSRLLATSGTRRSAFGAILGAALLVTASGTATPIVNSNGGARFFADDDRPTGPYGPIGLPGQNCVGACIHVCLHGPIFQDRCLNDCLSTCENPEFGGSGGIATIA